MCEEMRVTMKKGKQKNNATTRAGRKEELTAYLCLIPAFLGVTLISYLPTLAVFVLSLFDWNGITKPEFIQSCQHRHYQGLPISSVFLRKISISGILSKQLYGMLFWR